MKKKNIATVLILLALLALATFIAFRIQAVQNSSNQAENSDKGLILFYGDSCPHCINVEKFMADNKIEEKIAISKKEVFNDRNNASLLASKAKKCGMDTKNIGVPFLWDGAASQCLSGDTDIIKFFQDKISR